MKPEISAMVDGELDEDAFLAALELVKRDSDADESWLMSHMIGEALRGEAGSVSSGFSTRLLDRLESEPTVLAPAPRHVQSPFRRYSVALAASFMGVAMVAWAALAFNADGDGGFAGATEKNVSLGRIAAVQQKEVQQIPPQVRPGGVGDYLIAHHGFSLVGLSTASPVGVREVSALQDAGR